MILAKLSSIKLFTQSNSALDVFLILRPTFGFGLFHWRMRNFQKCYGL